METTLYIKNMVCHRCIKVVKDELSNLGYEVSKIDLGEATIKSSEKSHNITEIKKVLVENGFDLVDDKNSKLIEKIKVLIINKIHHQKDKLEKFSFSKYLANDLGVKLKSGGHLSGLHRTKIGDYHVNDAEKIGDFVKKLKPL